MASYDGFGMPSVDFSPLGQLPQIYQKAQQDAARQTTLANLGQGASAADIAKALFHAGDIEGGVALSKLADTQALREQTAAFHHDTVDYQNRSLAQTTAHQQALERLARDQYDNPKPTIHSSFNPATGQNEFFEVRPGQPVRNLSQPPAVAPSAPQPQAQVQAPPTGAAPLEPFAGRFAAVGDDPRTAALSPPAAPVAPVAPAAPPARASKQVDEVNETALSGLAPHVADLIKKVANYEINPASLSTRSGQRDFIFAKAAEYNPAFEQSFYPTKARTLGAFSAGPEARTVRAVNNLTDHLDVAEQLVKALDNGDIQLINAARNKFKTQFGYTAPTNVAAASQIVGGEISKVIAGVGSGGIAERAQAAASVLGQSQSTPQALSAINVIKQLMGGQIHGLENQYRTGTRLKDFRDRLSPGARKILDDMDKSAEDAAKPASEKQSGVVDWRSFFGGSK